MNFDVEVTNIEVEDAISDTAGSKVHVLAMAEHSDEAMVEPREDKASPISDNSFHLTLDSGVLVRLERLTRDARTQYVRGLVSVHNIAYEKHVTVRWSSGWETGFTDSDCKWEESAGELTADLFSFELPTTHPIELAVRYQVSGGEEWDNNSGLNYSV